MATGGRLVGMAIGATIMVAACGSSSKNASSAGDSAKSTAPSTTAPAAKGVTVETHSGSDGTYLTDGTGKTLYLFLADKGGRSACSGACATLWPPLTTTGAPMAGGDATTGMLATVARSDGTKQVTYAGHPLYYFQEDTATGDLNGQGVNGFGAKWWIVAPSGKSITTTGTNAAAATPSGTAAANGGY
jgi:predicted lipoprotein with Yx(FWY)xxD motif